jgi:hypothetical protein
MTSTNSAKEPGTHAINNSVNVLTGVGGSDGGAAHLLKRGPSFISRIKELGNAVAAIKIHIPKVTTQVNSRSKSESQIYLEYKTHFLQLHQAVDGCEEALSDMADFMLTLRKMTSLKKSVAAFGGPIAEASSLDESEQNQRKLPSLTDFEDNIPHWRSNSSNSKVRTRVGPLLASKLLTKFETAYSMLSETVDCSEPHV